MPKPRSSSLTAPGWTLATIASLTLLSQLPHLYDPTSFMERFDVQSPQAVRLIAFILVLVNIYDLLGALQNNYSIYYFSLLSRAAATLLFMTFGPLWQSMVGLEAATFVILGAALLWG